MIVVGVDPSLTGTGIAVVDTDDVLVIATHTITSAGRKDATLTERRERIAYIAERQIGDYALGLGDRRGETGRADLVVIEAPSLGQARQGGQFDRHGLWWLAVHRLHTLGIPVAAVAPNARAKYATGKGNASKEQVLLAVARRYPHVAVANNNEADALALAAMGARHLSQPIDDLPQTHLEALVKVQWPPVQAVA